MIVGGTIKLLVSLVRVYVLEGNVTRLAVVWSFLEFCLGFLLDVDRGGRRDGGRLFLLRLIRRVDESRVSHDIAAVRGCVRAAAAPMYAFPAAHRWAGGRRFTAVLF